MSTRTLYFPASTAARLERLREALGPGVPLSRIVAHAAAIAMQTLIVAPDARPWDHDVPDGGRATRHTVYLAADTVERLNQLRGIFIERDPVRGRVPTISVVVARAIALAERELLTRSRDDVELLRIEAEAEDLDKRLDEYEEAWGEDAIRELLGFMRANAELVTRAGRVNGRIHNEHVSPNPLPDAYVASSELMVGPLMRQSKRIIDLVIRARKETDRVGSVA